MDNREPWRWRWVRRRHRDWLMDLSVRAMNHGDDVPQPPSKGPIRKYKEWTHA